MKPSEKYNMCFFADYWDNQWRRRQQLAYRLSQREFINHLLYIESPLTATSFIKYLFGRADPEATQRWTRVFRNKSWTMRVSDKLTVLTTFSFLPPSGPRWLFKLSQGVFCWRVLNKIKSLCRRLNLKRIWVWVSHPQIPCQLIERLKPDVTWYDCTEDFCVWPGYAPCVLAQVKETDSYLTQKADVLSAVSHLLFIRKKDSNLNAYWLPNAVDVDLFLKPKESFEVPDEIVKAQRPVITFVGGLNNYRHDWALLDIVAAKRPGWTFLLIGSLQVSRVTRQMLSKHPNILCVGNRPYEELPQYLFHSDACFQFYLPGDLNDTGNSQKLFLYLAAGKPVISTPSADAVSYRDYIFIASNPEEFILRAEEALKDDSPAKVKARQEFARLNSWESRINEICAILKKKNLIL